MKHEDIEPDAYYWVGGRPALIRDRYTCYVGTIDGPVPPEPMVYFKDEAMEGFADMAKHVDPTDMFTSELEAVERTIVVLCELEQTARDGLNAALRQRKRAVMYASKLKVERPS